MNFICCLWNVLQKAMMFKVMFDNSGALLAYVSGNFVQKQINYITFMHVMENPQTQLLMLKCSAVLFQLLFILIYSTI